MKYRCLYIFKLPGSYIGLFIGLIFALQFKTNRMFLLEGSRDFSCDWNPIKGLSCSHLVMISIILLLVVGFVIGGIINKKIKNIKKYEKKQ